jgi:3-deoxy-D-manno-octulosonate 8-phosphate phosphatase (KDO 8-P phosphatase)
VDGILTNATVFMGSGGEFKQFHIRDGLGLRLLQREGIQVGWISNRPSVATAERAADLKIDFLFQEPGSKVAAAAAILKKAGFGWDDIVYMGDDIVDLGLMKRAGIAITVPDAIDEVKAIADYITTAHGGHGAVREVAGLILRAQGRWDKLIREFSA